MLRNHPIRLQRQASAPLEERYVDLLFQPVVDDDKRVTGIFAQGNDVTAAHQANRALSEKIRQLEDIRSRQAFRLELADRIRELADPDDVTMAACEPVGRKLEVSPVLYSEVDDDGARDGGRWLRPYAAWCCRIPYCIVSWS